MAQVVIQKNPPNTILDRFFGLNESINGDTQLKLGESPKMNNFRITSDYKLRSREGYNQLFTRLNNNPIRAFWYGEVNGETNLYFIQNKIVYKTDLDAVTTITTSTTSTDPLLFTWTNHDLEDGEPIQFSGLVSPVTSVISNSTTYYVKYLTANTFNISLTSGGAAIQNGSGQTNSTYNGIHTFEDIGSFTSDLKTHIYSFDEKLYFQNGEEFKVYTNLSDEIATITYTNTFPFLFKLTGHKFNVNKRIRLNGILPTGLNTSIDYYVIPIDFEYFYISSSEDGLPITSTVTGTSSNITIVPKLSNVGGYIPTVIVGRTPTLTPISAGTSFEQLNLLNNYRICQFLGNGSSKVFLLTETNINNVLFITDNGTVRTDYTVVIATGEITFTGSAPSLNSVVRIAYSKGTNTERTSDRNKIYNCRASMIYGGKNDTRVHTFGNENILYKATRFTTGIPFNFTTSAEYFPYNLNADIGDRSEAITDIVIQYDRQIIFKERSAFYSFIEYDNDTASFPVYPLNDTIGNTPFHQVRTIENNPFSVYTGVYQWFGTNVRDERNARIMSERVQYSYDNISNLSNVITHDFEESNEYWISDEEEIYIYGYLTNTWYKFTLNHTPTFFFTIGKYVYFSTTDGYIMKFGNDNIGFPLLNDNGLTFEKYWESGFYDFKINNIKKYMDKLWVSLQPSDDQEIDIYYVTNLTNQRILVSNLQYDIFTFFNFDFENVSFSTLINPQPFMRKLKAKKFVYFKLILENNYDDSRATILNITLPVRIGGEVK